MTAESIEMVQYFALTDVDTKFSQSPKFALIDCFHHARLLPTIMKTAVILK